MDRVVVTLTLQTVSQKWLDELNPIWHVDVTVPQGVPYLR